VPTDADPQIEELIHWLIGLGFRIVEDSYSEASFGDWLRVLHNATFVVQVIRDRGQWYVEAGNESRRFSMGAWSASLGLPQLEQLATSREQIIFMRKNLPRMQQAMKEDRSLAGRLWDVQRQATGLPDGLALSGGGRLAPSVNKAQFQREAAARLVRAKRTHRRPK
jgi:hypothetical protein